MATATRIPAKPVEDTRDVQLTLTHEEAVTLRRLLGWHIVGSYNGPRKHTNAIFNALSGAGIKNTKGLNLEDKRFSTLFILPDEGTVA